MDEGTQFASVLARIGRDVLKQLEGLSDELLNRPLALPETNTLFALATHIAGSTEFWVLEMAGGRRVDRNRQAEFRSAGRREDLMHRRAWRAAALGSRMSAARGGTCGTALRPHSDHAADHSR